MPAYESPSIHPDVMFEQVIESWVRISYVQWPLPAFAMRWWLTRVWIKGESEQPIGLRMVDS